MRQLSFQAISNKKGKDGSNVENILEMLYNLSEKEAHPLCVLSHIWGSTPDDAGARIISIHMRKFPIGILQLRVENIIIKVLRLQSADIHDPAYIHIHIL